METPLSVLKSFDDLSSFIETHDDEPNDELLHLSEIQMCIVNKNSRTACCYYDRDLKRLFYLKDYQETDEFDLAKLLIKDLRPRLVLTSDNCDGRFLRFLKKCVERPSNESASSQDPNAAFSAQFQRAEIFKTLKVVSSNDFEYESAKSRIFSLESLTDMPCNMNESEKIIYFSALFDLECRLGVGCVGALLKYLNHQHLHAANLDHQPFHRLHDTFLSTYANGLNNNSQQRTSPQILSVRPVNVDKLLILDANVFKSLEIFSDVDMSCAHKQTDAFSSGEFRTCLNNKNSTRTLYGLYLSKIRTRMGIYKLRSIMLKPTRDKCVLDERHRLVEFFMMPCNQPLVGFLHAALKSCKYIGPVMKRMKTAKCTLSDWKRLLVTTQAFLKITHVVRILNELLNKMTPPKINKKSENESMFEKMLDTRHSERFESLYAVLTSTINFKESTQEKCVVVNNSTSMQLQEKRQFFAMLPEFLTAIAQEEIQKLNIVRCSMVYLPMLGFLIKIKNDDLIGFMEMHRSKDSSSFCLQQDETTGETATSYSSSFSMPGGHHQHATTAAQPPSSLASTTNISSTNENVAKRKEQVERARGEFERRHPGFRHVYTSDLDCCFKNAKCRELDAEIGDISLEICDIEMQILEWLQSLFVHSSHLFAETSDLCSELDCLMAFAQVAQDNEFVRPQLDLDDDEDDDDDDDDDCTTATTRSYIHADGVRHPLVQLSLENHASSFVPNSIRSGDENENKIKVITGPNASGKTTYLKQIGLLVYMSMIGSYVAASRACLGDFDRIYTRIASNECISLQMSSFSIDLKHLTAALNGSTRKTLVLVDELGRGTQLEDGQALVASVLRYFLCHLNRSHAQIPHVFLTTHFYEIFRFGSTFFSDCLGVANRLSFLSLTSVFEDCQSQPAYKLIDGIAKSSHGTDLAEQVGISKSIIEKSKQIYHAISSVFGDQVEEEGDRDKVIKERKSIMERNFFSPQSILSKADKSDVTKSMIPEEQKLRKQNTVKEALKLNIQILQEDKEMRRKHWKSFLKQKFISTI